MNLRTQPYASFDDIDSAALNPVAEEELSNSFAGAAPPFAAAPAANANGAAKKPIGKSTFRKKIQLHTHWVNDIVLANNYQSGEPIYLFPSLSGNSCSIALIFIILSTNFFI